LAQKKSRSSLLSNLENIYLFIQGLDRLTYVKGVQFSSHIMNSVFNLYEECLLAHEGIRFKRVLKKEKRLQIIRELSDRKLLIN
jgi:hypothetical protein